MATGVGPPAASGARELLIVLALALLGLLLAGLAALTPWYPAMAGTGVAPVVDVDLPRQPTGQS